MAVDLNVGAVCSAQRLIWDVLAFPMVGVVGRRANRHGSALCSYSIEVKAATVVAKRNTHPQVPPR